MIDFGIHMHLTLCHGLLAVSDAFTNNFIML